jgi:hypothetical protein
MIGNLTDRLQSIVGDPDITPRDAIEVELPRFSNEVGASHGLALRGQGRPEGIVSSLVVAVVGKGGVGKTVRAYPRGSTCSPSCWTGSDPTPMDPIVTP